MYDEYDLIKALQRLKKSKFRSSFNLSAEEKKIVEKKGFIIMRKHALEILNKRIRIRLRSDGKQTPLKGYVIFVAQHATACCCRKCIEKWYKISRNKILSEMEMNFFADLIIYWMKEQVNKI